MQHQSQAGGLAKLSASASVSAFVLSTTARDVRARTCYCSVLSTFALS